MVSGDGAIGLVPLGDWFRRASVGVVASGFGRSVATVHPRGSPRLRQRGAGGVGRCTEGGSRERTEDRGPAGRRTRKAFWRPWDEEAS